MKLKKVLAAVMTLAMSASVLAGCGGNNNTAQTQTTDNAAQTTDSAAQTADNAAQTTQEETKTDADAGAQVEEQVLKVAAFEGGYGAEMWSEVAAAFEASHPGVTVELTVDKKLEDVISPSMKAGDYPDVVHLATGREAALTETLMLNFFFLKKK